MGGNEMRGRRQDSLVKLGTDAHKARMVMGCTNVFDDKWFVDWEERCTEMISVM